MSKMYSQYAADYAKVVKDNIYNAHLERPSTLALLDDVSGKKVLDLGCGSGEYARWLLEHGVSALTCIDISAEMVAITQQRFGQALKAYVQDLAHGLPNEGSASVDVIIAPLVMHYIEDLTPLFTDIARVLKPTGYLVFSTHHPFADFLSSKSNNYFEQESITQTWDTLGYPVEVRFYRRSLTQLCQIITDAGLVMSKITEGEVDEQAKLISKSTYHHLRHNPNFIFIRCQKPI